MKIKSFRQESIRNLKILEFSFLYICHTEASLKITTFENQVFCKNQEINQDNEIL